MLAVMPLVYNLLLLATSPLLLLYLFYRLVLKGKSREGLAQRLGAAPLLPPPPSAGRVWMHAVSAGEVVAAAAIARRLEDVAPEIEIAISTTTPAGQQQARRLIPRAVAWFYFPFDFLPCVWIALVRVRPTVVATVETEIWPNWLWVARLLGIRTALVNGQFADKGFRGARRFRPLYRWALGRIEALRMQTDQAAERALYLGACPARLRVTGNAKFEQPVARPAEVAASIVRSRLQGETNRPLWIAGSTHPGEEEQVMEAFTRSRRVLPALSLLLVPRHIERAAELCDRLRSDGWTAALRTEPGESVVDVLVLDSMGELAGLYQLADVVFVGGSLVPIGGHDILQPLFFGKPTLVGPHTHNQHDLVRLAEEQGAVLRVSDSASLADAVVRTLTDSTKRKELLSASERLLRQNTGAALECANVLKELARGEFRPGAEPCGIAPGAAG